jgi:ABC-type nitrate/sulfonate/bicarbonate transport system substrate-binding protein
MPASLIAKGYRISLLKLADFGVKQYGLNIIANESALIDGRAETVRRVAEAIDEGYDFVTSNPEKAIEIFMNRFPQRDRAYVEQSIKMVVAELGTGPVGRQTREGWSSTIDSLSKLGLLPKPITVDHVAAMKLPE